ncbi:MAG: riboflavin biosynthesis protein RibF [Peptococcaceae bacterium]|nr:riboflavin biosynthesis protein RibF [Peptococcaceae bacterium]
MIVTDSLAKIKEYAWRRRLYVALGYFDGVHLGHQALLKKTADLAAEAGGEPCVMLLEPHPLKVLFGPKALKNLNTLEEKIRLIQSRGPFNVFILDFTRDFAAIDPEAFARLYLQDLLKAEGVVCGYNYSFGRMGAGKAEDLKTLGKEYGFQCRLVPQVSWKGRQVSSTEIRRLVEEGRMLEAQMMLGHPHLYAGKVVGGNHLGSRMGFPTANIEIPEGLVWPAYGVYAAYLATEDGRIMEAILNAGIRPTVTSDQAVPSFEAHILNYSGNLYGRKLRLVLSQQLRRERPFGSVEELFGQVSKDKKKVGPALTDLRAALELKPEEMF